MSLVTIPISNLKSWHNPAGVTAESLGHHHKLLSTEDLSKPLPEGAEYWDDTHRRWETVYRTGIEKPHKFFTYRIPLTLSDRLKTELQKAGWSPLDIQEFEQWFNAKKPTPPTPQTTPWTLESHPDVVCVKRRNVEGHYDITAWRAMEAYVSAVGWIPYSDLHRDWLQRNGDAAGQEVEG